MVSSIEECVDSLNAHLPGLESRRTSNGFANDVYEAAWYWRELGNWVLGNNTRVDYPARALEELGLLARLREALPERPPEERRFYESLFAVAEQALLLIRKVNPPSDGHLGVLRIIRTLFGFLETDYGYGISDTHPTGIRYSSGAVYLALEFSHRADLSCTFGLERETNQSFSIETLLFLCGDESFRHVSSWQVLDTTRALESWSEFVAGVWRRYGHDVLTNQPGVFERLSRARTMLDEEYDREVRRSGPASG